MDAQTTIDSAIANGYDRLSYRDILLCILEGITSGGGSGGTGDVQGFSGNYGGGTPTDTPTTSVAIAYDTSNGQPWAWYSGAWH